MFSVCVGRGGVHFLLTEGCSDLFGEIARLKRSLYGLKQASRSLHCHLAHGIKCVGFEQSAAYDFALRLAEQGVVSMMVVDHVDEIPAIGKIVGATSWTKT